VSEYALADNMNAPATLATPGGRHGRQVPCGNDLTTQLFTLAEARAILDDPVRDQRYLDTLLGPHVRDYIAWKRAGQPSLRTIDTYERILARLCVQLPPELGVDDVSDVDLLLMLETVPLKSHRLHRSAWNGFFKWAIKRGRRSAINPVDDLPDLLNQSRAAVHRIFTEAEQAALVNASRFMDDPPHDRARARLLLDTGIRKGEARGLRVGDVDPTGRCITVLGKGGKQRLIPVRGEFWQEWELFLMAPIPKLGWPLELGDYVWFPMRVAGEYGNRARQVTASYPDRPMGECSMHSWWSRLAGHAGIEYRKLHMTRHTYATDALDATEGDLYGVSEVLGHSSTKVTEVYLHSSKRRMESVADKLNRARRDA
jgi:site-specific recombinase XerC